MLTLLWSELTASTRHTINSQDVRVRSGVHPPQNSILSHQLGIFHAAL